MKTAGWIVCVPFWIIGAILVLTGVLVGAIPFALGWLANKVWSGPCNVHSVTEQ